VTPLHSGPWPTRQTPARHLPSRSRPRVRDHAAWLVRSASPAHDQHPCAAVISAITFRVPLSLYKPRHRKSPFPSTRAPSHHRVIAALPLRSSKLPSPPPLPVHRRDAATVTTHPSRTLFLVTGPPEGNATARRRPLSLFQEVPVRALHVPRSVSAVAALPSALGEIPVPRAFRFAASGRFP